MNIFVIFMLLTDKQRDYILKVKTSPVVIFYTEEEGDQLDLARVTFCVCSLVINVSGKYQPKRLVTEINRQEQQR